MYLPLHMCFVDSDKNTFLKTILMEKANYVALHLLTVEPNPFPAW